MKDWFRVGHVRKKDQLNASAKDVSDEFADDQDHGCVDGDDAEPLDGRRELICQNVEIDSVVQLLHFRVAICNPNLPVGVCLIDQGFLSVHAF